MVQKHLGRLLVLIGLMIITLLVLAFANWQLSQLPTQAAAVETLVATEPQCQDRWHVEERSTVPVPGPYGLPLSQQWLVCTVTGTEILIRHR